MCRSSRKARTRRELLLDSTDDYGQGIPCDEVVILDDRGSKPKEDVTAESRQILGLTNAKEEYCSVMSRFTNYTPESLESQDLQMLY